MRKFILSHFDDLNTFPLLYTLTTKTRIIVNLLIGNFFIRSMRNTFFVFSIIKSLVFSFNKKNRTSKSLNKEIIQLFHSFFEKISGTIVVYFAQFSPFSFPFSIQISSTLTLTVCKNMYCHLKT